MSVMAKKQTGGAHKTKRVVYQIPEAISKLIRKQAALRQQPAMWYLVRLVLDDAKANGVSEDELPVPPWEEGEEAR